MTKKELATVVRRFIIRFLRGNLQDEEFGSDKEIFEFLNAKQDLWNNLIFENKNRQKEIMELRAFRLCVKHSFTLYHLLGGDSELPKQEVIKKPKKEDIEDDEKIKKKKRKKIIE